MAAGKALGRMLGQMEAALMLMSNRERVVKDITNPGPAAVGGGQLTQLHLKRVDSRHISHVRAMVRAVCCRLLGKETEGASSPEQALVWAEAAGFLCCRI